MPNCELNQAFMHVIVTGKYVKDPIKNNPENAETLFSKIPIIRSGPIPYTAFSTPMMLQVKLGVRDIQAKMGKFYGYLIKHI